MSSMCTLDLSYAWLSRLSAYVHIVYVLCMRVHAIRTTLFFSSFFSFGNPRYSRCHDNIYIYILVQAIHSLIWRTTKLNLLEIAFGHFVFFGDAALFVVVAVYYVLYFWWLGFGVQINMRYTHRTVFFFFYYLFENSQFFFFGSASVNGISAAYNSQWMDASLAKYCTLQCMQIFPEYALQLQYPSVHMCSYILLLWHREV